MTHPHQHGNTNVGTAFAAGVISIYLFLLGFLMDTSWTVFRSFINRATLILTVHPWYNKPSDVTRCIGEFFIFVSVSFLSFHFMMAIAKKAVQIF